MEEVQEMKTLVAHLFDCLKILNDTNRKMYENQQIIMKKIQNQENILKKFVNFYPRLQEQEHQQELLSKRFYEHVQTTNSEFERLKEKFENESKVSFIRPTQKQFQEILFLSRIQHLLHWSILHSQHKSIP